MLTRTDTPLDRPMILFQDIVEILHRSMSTVLLQNTGGFELNDGWRISSVLVGIDHPRREMVPSHEELDNPGNAKSKEYYAMAKNATGAFILCVLSNLDQDQNAYIKDCGDRLNIYLNAQLRGSKLRSVTEKAVNLERGQ